MINYNEITKNVKKDSFRMATLKESVRNNALIAIAKSLSDNKEEIFNANAEDLAKAKADQLPPPIINRLKFDEHKLNDILSLSLIHISEPTRPY